ncbi:MAG: hypothetical protein BGO41_07555 [Clostridiales bacterium 38-18]|nr:MAG: hypothetical protein BGO41_07555 [Clostridiales bacterium 38-18]
MFFKSIIFILGLVNLSAFISMLLDKRYAVKGKWRLSENLLLLHAFFGGGIGMVLGMIIAKHKLSKPRFRWTGLLSILIYLLIMGYFVATDHIIYV